MAMLYTDQESLLIIGSFVLSVASAVGGAYFKVRATAAMISLR
jgi:hypothetical protein